MRKKHEYPTFFGVHHVTNKHIFQTGVLLPKDDQHLGGRARAGAGADGRGNHPKYVPGMKTVDVQKMVMPSMVNSLVNNRG